MYSYLKCTMICTFKMAELTSPGICGQTVGSFSPERLLVEPTTLQLEATCDITADLPVFDWEQAEADSLGFLDAFDLHEG